jgi:predicted ATPase
VATRISLLRATVNRIDADAAGDAIARDLILPNVRLLAEFCENVDIDGPRMRGGA